MIFLRRQVFQFLFLYKGVRIIVKGAIIQKRGILKEFTYDVLIDIAESLFANGISRSLAIMGGEPLCEQNIFLTLLVVKTIKEKYPDVKIYIWSGYTYDYLMSHITTNLHLK